MKPCKQFLSILTAAALTIGTASMLSGNRTIAAEETPLRVMPLGDSITDGYWMTGGYRLTLCDLLQQNGWSEQVDFVGPNWGGDCYDPQHAGYSGYSIDNIAQEDSISGARTGLSSFVDWLMDTYPADVVMLQIGTNDILSYYDLEHITDRLEGLVNTILTHLEEDDLLYVATLPCMDATNTLYINEYYFTVESMDNIVDTYNAEIREMVAEMQAEGKPVALADIASVVGKEDLYDGVHPNADGYQKMGTYWYGKLTEYMQGEVVLPTDEPTEEITEPTEETETPTDEPTEMTEETEAPTDEPTEPTEETEIPTDEPTEPTEETEIPTDEPTEPTENPTRLLGDIVFDGEVNLADVVALQRYLLGQIEIDTDTGLCADLNGDQRINGYDLAFLKRAVVYGKSPIDVIRGV